MKTRGKGVLTQLSHSALLLIAVGMGNAYAATDTAIITITGKVVANTCTMSSGSATQTVTLNDIADRDIRGKGVTGGDKNISIVLKDCGTAASAVKVSAWGVLTARITRLSATLLLKVTAVRMASHSIFIRPMERLNTTPMAV